MQPPRGTSVQNPMTTKQFIVPSSQQPSLEVQIDRIEQEIHVGSVYNGLLLSLNVLAQDNYATHDLAKLTLLRKRDNNICYSNQVYQFFRCRAEKEPSNPVHFYMLGLMYAQGTFVQKDLKEALSNLNKAVDLNFAQAVYESASIRQEIQEIADEINSKK